MSLVSCRGSAEAVTFQNICSYIIGCTCFNDLMSFVSMLACDQHAPGTTEDGAPAGELLGILRQPA